MTLKNLILTLFVSSVFSCKTENNINPKDYVDLVYYHDKNDNFSHIGSKVIDADDSIGMFIQNHKPRFSYFFSNKIDMDTLELIYPDTVEINKLFLKQINQKKFISNFSKLANIKKQENDIFSMDEIMKVASRFFVVVNKKNGLMLKICAGGNDFKDLNAIKDMTLVESMTYEAIMSAFAKKRVGRPEFISVARTNFSNAIKNPENLNTNTLIELARNKVYESMEKDKSLRDFMTEYFVDNSTNLPFEIQLNE